MTLTRSENDEPAGSEPVFELTTEERERQSRVTSRRASRALANGLQFGKYRIVRLIGIGGMSEIYEAIHLGLRKRVALKTMRRDLAESPEARQRFIAEGIHAARIRHTNVVDVTDVGEVDELPFLVMNLLEGEDLGRVFDRQGRIPVAEMIDLLLPVAAAVALGHEKGVVHRDLKPDNIFLHREGLRVIPKVLDFGVSRVMNARRITLNSSVFGTPHYMSPEQARGGPTDARTDQYSLGVILYEGVTGKLPRDSSNPIELLHAVAYEGFRPPSDHFEVPPELEAVILRAMAREPEQRFDSMRELAMALVPFASESSREYWSVELGLTAADRVSETRTMPQPVRHPSPVPHAVATADREVRSGDAGTRGVESSPAVPFAPHMVRPPPRYFGNAAQRAASQPRQSDPPPSFARSNSGQLTAPAAAPQPQPPAGQGGRRPALHHARSSAGQLRSRDASPRGTPANARPMPGPPSQFGVPQPLHGRQASSEPLRHSQPVAGAQPGAVHRGGRDAPRHDVHPASESDPAQDHNLRAARDDHHPAPDDADFAQHARDGHDLAHDDPQDAPFQHAEGDSAHVTEHAEQHTTHAFQPARQPYDPRRQLAVQHVQGSVVHAPETAQHARTMPARQPTRSTHHAPVVQPAGAPIEVDMHSPRRPRRRERLAWLLAAVLPLVAVGGLWVWKREPRASTPAAATSPDAAEYFEIDVQANPPHADLHLDGKRVAVGRFTTRLKRDGTERELTATAHGWNAASVRFRDHAPPKDLRLVPAAPPSAATAPLANASDPAATPGPAAVKAAAKPAARRTARETPDPAPAPNPPSTPTSAPATSRPNAHAAKSAQIPTEPPTPADAPAPTHLAHTEPSARAQPANVERSDPFEAATPSPKLATVDARAPNPRVAVVEADKPNVRLVDEDEPKIQLVE